MDDGHFDRVEADREGRVMQEGDPRHAEEVELHDYETRAVITIRDVPDAQTALAKATEAVKLANSLIPHGGYDVRIDLFDDKQLPFEA